MGDCSVEMKNKKCIFGSKNLYYIFESQNKEYILVENHYALELLNIS